MSRPPLGSTLDIWGLSISWYSLLMMTAIAIGIVLAQREEKRLSLPKDSILSMALWAIPLGVVGARLYYVAFTFSRYANDPWEILRTWNGGLALYGAVIGGIAAAAITAWRKKISLLKLMDACAPALALAQAIGRWGNYANMEAYGARIYEPSLQFFPLAVEIRLLGANGTEYWYWHLATFFFESVWCLVVFILLMTYRKKMKRSGDVVCWYVLLYAAGRAVIEGLRDDSLLLNISAAQVRVSQILSAVIAVVVIAIFFTRLKRQKKLRIAEWLCWGITALGIACAFVGEFERNAYLGLFKVAQILLGLLAALDIVFFIHYYKRAKVLRGPAVWMLAMAGLSLLMLVLGFGREGQGNTLYITLRQAVSMAHVALAGAWFYLRGNTQRRPRPRQVAARATQVDAEPNET